MDQCQSPGPVTVSFLIVFASKYVKPKAKTRPDFQSSLCFRENRKNFTSWEPKPQAPRGVYLIDPQSSVFLEAKQALQAPPNTSTTIPGKPMTVPRRLTRSGPHRHHHTTLLDASAGPINTGAYFRLHLIFTGFVEQSCRRDTTWATSQQPTPWTSSWCTRNPATVATSPSIPVHKAVLSTTDTTTAGEPKPAVHSPRGEEHGEHTKTHKKSWIC